jgi:hypothetical protein
MAFGERAFIQSIRRSTHLGMNERSSRLDDDGDLIAVAVAEPIEGMAIPILNSWEERPHMPASVTPEYLLEGAAYALEQCGLLLRDANLLYQSGSYASAVALALFAREELGRYRILLDLRKQVLGGDHLTIQKIEKRCRDHERKQEAGMLSFVMRVDTDTALGGLLGTYLNVKAWERGMENGKGAT